MHIQFTTDSSIGGHEGLAIHIKDVVESVLSR